MVRRWMAEMMTTTARWRREMRAFDAREPAR
jgi:hypothetical protein